MKNANIEISGVLPDSGWIRVATKEIRDDCDTARAAILSNPTGPSQLYHLCDGIFEVLRLKDTVCIKYNLTAEPEINISTQTPFKLKLNPSKDKDKNNFIPLSGLYFFLYFLFHHN